MLLTSTTQTPLKTIFIELAEPADQTLQAHRTLSLHHQTSSKQEI